VTVTERRAGRAGLVDTSGVRRDAGGMLRYADRPPCLVTMLRASVDRDPHAEAVVEVGGDTLTYRGLWDRAARVAGGLRAAGARPGDRVAIRLAGGADWVVAFVGVQLAGCVAVPVNPALTAPEVAHVVADAGVAVMIEPGRWPDGPPAAVEERAPDDIAAIFYTSGTTGRPKGAMTSHANFLTNNENARRVLRIPAGRGWRMLISVPLFHVTGCNSQLLPALEHGGAVVILPRFDPSSLLRSVREQGVTALMSVPAIYSRVVAASRAPGGTGGVTSLTYGGAPVPVALPGRLAEAFPNARLGNGFGLTETSSFCTYLPHEHALARPDSVGFAMPVVELRLRDRRPDGAGELLVRGPNVVGGYWGNPAGTAAAFDGGWLRTGDLARIDPDGFVGIVDRVKDVVIRAGENVYSAEIEQVLGTHPDVVEAAVVGVPDDLVGEKVAAALVIRPGIQPDLRAVFRHARTHLARYKVPELVTVWPSALPRNPAGKIVKDRVRDTAGWRVAPR
jgi:long-chain acyl-CoA synthetase